MAKHSLAQNKLQLRQILNANVNHCLAYKGSILWPKKRTSELGLSQATEIARNTQRTALVGRTIQLIPAMSIEVVYDLVRVLSELFISLA